MPRRIHASNYLCVAIATTRLPPTKFPLFFSQIQAHHCGQTHNKNGAKPHSCNSCGLCLHHMRTDSMLQNTHPKKENKFPLLAEKMKIYLHKL
ncbi:hypothetical protein CPter91_0691 [Collimonas pratensis]|uniref:Uncharacterized protein n=1 Tax=Collimonas pratensis TaxID=279113 RepID=A0A127PZA3_9BURK|nr:hypothetical protein CPter91_0691 [Collimonas pratensis]